MSFPGEYLARQVAPDGRDVTLAAETVPRIYGCRTLAHVRARMARHEDFPAPVGRIGRWQVYMLSAIEAWAESSDRIA